MSSTKQIKEKLDSLMNIDSKESESKPEKRDLKPIEAPVAFEKGAKRSESSEEKEEDFVHVRKTLHSMLEKGQEALEHVLRELAYTNHPRAAEVAASLIKTISETGGDLMELHEKMEEKQESTSGQGTTNNAFFLGTPSDLLEAMKQAQENDVIEIKKNDE